MGLGIPGRSDVLLHQTLVEVVKRAQRVCDKGRKGVDKQALVAAVPLEPPCVAVSQK